MWRSRNDHVFPKIMTLLKADEDQIPSGWSPPIMGTVGVSCAKRANFSVLLVVP